MWTRLVSAVSAVAAVFSVWWVAQHDESRSLGEVVVLVVANPPSASTSDAAKDATGRVDHDACSGFSPALTPSEVEWSSATQPTGVRACRWLKHWRLADLVRRSLPGEPRVEVRDGIISVALDPLPPAQRAGITTFGVTVVLPGEILASSGAGEVSGSTVRWSNPSDFFSGVGLSASGRDRPLLIGLLPWLAGALALVALVGALPRRRAAGARGGAGAADHTDRPGPSPLVAPVPGPPPAGRPDRAAPTPPGAAAASRTGDDPTSPWRPPSPR